MGLSSNFSKATQKKQSKKDKKKKAKPFNLEEEIPKMKSVIAESSVSSTNLLNALQLINREHEQVSENATAAEQFETCKSLRRHVLRYVSAGAIRHHHSKILITACRFNMSSLSNGLEL